MFHVKHGDLAGQAVAVGVPLDADAVRKLAGLEELLLAFAVPKGFVAAGDGPAIRKRHVLDSLRAAAVVEGDCADIGSGSGLPGLVVAIARPDIGMDLIEPRRRRLAFLELAVERLGLPNAHPLGRRIEDLHGHYSVALARAFADARASWLAAERVLGPDGALVYFAGRGFRATEVEDLRVLLTTVPAPSLLASAGPLVIMTRQ